MVRKKQPPLPKDYFTALQRIFEVQTEVLTAVLPHSGERGRNDEERFREFLRRSLPHRFSLGTGFLVCSDSSVPESNQTDIVIFDEFINSPLHRELAAFVYPIEIVYGCVEVKGLLKSSDLTKCLAGIAKIRALAKAKKYLLHTPVQMDPNDPTKLAAGHLEVQNKLSPRTYVVAYDVKGWSSLKSFAAAWKRALLKNRDAHLHGVAVLSKNWFVFQHVHTGEGVMLQEHADHVLARLVSKVVDDISSMEMLPASMHRYLQLDTSNPALQGTPASGHA